MSFLFLCHIDYSLFKNNQNVKSFNKALERKRSRKGCGMKNKKQIFSEAQLSAINHDRGPALVLAGPGSGKTTTITYRVKKLIEMGVRPEAILVVTFTKAAAVNMTDRFRTIMDGKTLPVTFATFHSIFYKILRNEQSRNITGIISETEKINIIKEIVIRKKLDVLSLNDFAVNMLDEICRAKGNMIDVKEYNPINCKKETFSIVFAEYERAKEAEKKLDFEDMIILCYKLLKDNQNILNKWQNIFSYILIDEFQDINSLQYEIIKMLAYPSNNIFVVGDDDQSIYGFRGARPDIMFRFKDEFNPKQYFLTENYRSTDEIVEMSANLICHNNKRFDKNFYAMNGHGQKPEILTFKNQAEQLSFMCKQIKAYENAGVKKSDIAILVRNNSQIEPVNTMLKNYNILSSTKNKSNDIYSSIVSKDILAYIIASQNWSKISFRENEELMYVLNKPGRLISRQMFLEPGMDIKKLKEAYAHNNMIVNQIESLDFHMRMIATLPPYGAVNYIRNAVGYEGYIREYAGSHSIKITNLIKQLDDIQSDACRYDTLQLWLDSINAHNSNKTHNGGDTYDGAQQNNEDRQNHINLITMHNSKGLEFRIVFIINANQGIIPSSRALRDRDFEEERRVFYVAMTRAKERLHIFCARNVLGCEAMRSMFVDEILE